MRGLLAGTCLTVATTAHAGTVSEPPEFAKSLAAAVASPLAVGTTGVTGTAPGFQNTADKDYVDFVGLLAGGSFTLQFNTTDGGGLDFAAYDTSGSQFGSTTFDLNSATITGTTPGNGQLVAFIGGDEGGPYSVTLTAVQAPTTAPEPATAALAGLGVAAAGLLAARRRKQSR